MSTVSPVILSSGVRPFRSVASLDVLTRTWTPTSNHSPKVSWAPACGAWCGTSSCEARRLRLLPWTGGIGQVLSCAGRCGAFLPAP